MTKHHIRVSNIILTTNLLTLMVRHIRIFFLIFSDESGHWPLRQRCVHIHMLLNSAAHRINLYLHYHHLKKYPMFIKVCFLAQARRERERNLNCPSHHISFVWYWTTFRNTRRLNIEQEDILYWPLGEKICCLRKNQLCPVDLFVFFSSCCIRRRINTNIFSHPGGPTWLIMFSDVRAHMSSVIII